MGPATLDVGKTRALIQSITENREYDGKNRLSLSAGWTLTRALLGIPFDLKTSSKSPAILGSGGCGLQVNAYFQPFSFVLISSLGGDSGYRGWRRFAAYYEK